jgi:DNA-binding NarL/FixJ family response regulator
VKDRASLTVISRGDAGPMVYMRVLIVDDNEPVRRAVGHLFTPASSLEVCGEASNAAEALEKVRGLRPDVVLVDMSMPGANGLDTARLIRKEMPEIKILIMSHHDPQVPTTAALEAGANGSVDKSTLSLDVLARAIKTLDRGQ